MGKILLIINFVRFMTLEMIFNELYASVSIQNQPVFLQELAPFKIQLDIKREDLIHSEISGNKFRKLKYNVLEAKKANKKTLLTFGGAYSNHIAATAVAGKLFGFKTIGIIRGEELTTTKNLNSTLTYAQSQGMHLRFISREAYKEKDTSAFLQKLENDFGDFYHLPEGGTNSLAIKGCEEILTKHDTNYDYICVSVGTGGTMTGIINASTRNQKIIGYSALKGDFLKNEIVALADKDNWKITDDYCFGGYAKVNATLIDFINNFKKTTLISLDPVYTGKMLYGITDMVKKEKIQKNSRILAIHTGGLQGITGMNTILKNKNLPLITV